MTNRQNPSSPTPINFDSLFHVVILVCFVVVVSYLAARLGGALVLRPEMIWPVWPGCAFLVAVLLLTPRRIWPAILLAGLVGFALYDLQENLPIRTIGLLLLADSVEILVAALGVRYLFAGVPHLNSVRSLAKYSLFAVILAPISVASTAGSAVEGDSWWVGFFTEALALLTLTPAILSWTAIARTRARRPKVHYLEAATLFLGLGTVAYFTFVASGIENRPALLYSLVPFLLWAALRFGITGISNSMVLVAFLAIFGVVHGRGPFTGDTPVDDVLSLQFFLLVSASSFMVLAAVVEGRKTAEQTVRERETALRASEERLRLAQQAARIGTFEWDIQTGVNTWTPELEEMYGLPPSGFGGTQTAFENLVQPDDRAGVIELNNWALKTGKPAKGEWRVVWPDGSVHWIAGCWQVFMNESGRPSRMIGVNADVTERKVAEEAVRESEDRLRLLLDSTAEAIYGIDLEHRCTFCNPACLRTLGYERIDQVLGKNMHDLLHHSRADGTFFPVEECRVDRVTQTGEGVHAEDEVFWRANGTRFPTEYWSYPQRIGQKLVGAVVAFTDITERKLAQAALVNVSRRLIEAHEQERTRIGRDLHDDVVQRLALLSIELEGVQQDVPDAASELRTRIGALRSETTLITNDVQVLSHELHSSKLEYLGMVGATKNFCKELSEHQKVEIDFQSYDLPPALPTDVSISLFRVLQEALRNATKHSGVKRFEVCLWGSTGEVHLTVSDLGAGFDIEAAMKSTGLGLTSMQERLRLVDGELSINSRPEGGTTVHARVPFHASSDSGRAAG